MNIMLQFSFAVLFCLFSSISLAKENYIRVQKFKETIKNTVVIPSDETYPEISKGWSTVITEGLLKWKQDDPNGFVLDIEIQETNVERKHVRTEEPPKIYEQEWKMLADPYTARVWCKRGDSGELKISITENRDENSYLGNQYVRVAVLLDNLLLAANAIHFKAKPKQGKIDCIVDYIDVVNCDDRYTQELSMLNFRPSDLKLIYNCKDQGCTTFLEFYDFDRETSQIVKFIYDYCPTTDKVLGMKSVRIQSTNSTNLAELLPAELYKRLNNPDVPLRRSFYEIKLSE